MLIRDIIFFLLDTWVDGVRFLHWRPPGFVEVRRGDGSEVVNRPVPVWELTARPPTESSRCFPREF